ncbi:DUF493 family protein [Pseudodesulfovibrio sp. zrk46]|uniref:DUF493 family protein n=1 Tax=Pseudodesulfovibrio sp. zrk46 TaxID=2725288 RepID=UPI00144938CF|nr:DUF493 family protein [Pseudodesulfovibrio sp. zrk46]QJB57780.1 DUF493 domain-containing protein [Pseudodesulfovibrio sp. zrk46]
MTNQHEQFQNILDEHHQWPCPYLFKFIVPTENLSKVMDLFQGEEVNTRESKNGKYTSVSVESNMCSSKDVMEVYAKVSAIPGVMSL